MSTLEKRAPSVESIARAEKISRMVLTVVVIAMMLTVSAFAAGEGGGKIAGAIADGMKSIYGVITSVVMPIATVVFAFSAAKMLFGGQKAMEQGQGKLLTTLIVLAGIYLAPIIIEQVSGWFKDMATDTSVWTTT